MSRSRCSTICRLSVTETMWTAGWDAGIEESLRELRLDGNRYLDTGREPEPRHHGKKCTVALTVAFLGLIIAVVVLAGSLDINSVVGMHLTLSQGKGWPCPSAPGVVLLHQRSSAALGPMCPACTDGWIGYRGKCYYFSEAKGNWTYSQKHCSSLNASLAAIDTQQDLDFMLRYKGNFDHWIGLRRDLGQPWKWANGTEFNHLFPITADGDCAYLTANGVSSLRCTSERYWICTNPDPFTKAKGG